MSTEKKAGTPTGITNSDFHELFIDGLQDIYWAESHLVKALPKMIKGASSSTLKAGIEKHLKETETHVQRLEQIFTSLGEPAKAKVCEAMKGLLKEAEEIMDETKNMDAAVIDAAIIFAGQKIEHYEIATYGGLAAMSTHLEDKRVNAMLSQTLEEEKKADALLSQVAVNEVNPKAATAK